LGLFLALVIFMCPNGSVAAGSDAQVETSLRAFAGQYMQSLRKENCRSPQKSRVESYEGGYCIRSVVYDGSWSVELKKTESKATPYIGVLTYQERHLVRYGPEEKDLANQPEVTVAQIPVTEIFRFSKGNWVY